MSNFLKRVLGDNQKGTVRRLKRRTNDVNKLEPVYQAMSDKELSDQTMVLKERLKKNR